MREYRPWGLEVGIVRSLTEEKGGNSGQLTIEGRGLGFIRAQGSTYLHCILPEPFSNRKSALERVALYPYMSKEEGESGRDPK